MIQTDPYKGLVLVPSKTERPQTVTTGIDALPIYEFLTSDHNETPEKIEPEKPEPEKPKKVSKQEKKLQRQEKKIRISQRRLEKKMQTTNGDALISENTGKISLAIKSLNKKYHRNQEQKLIQYGTVALYSDDLAQITPGEWINDNIISIVYEFLAETYIEKQMKKFIRFINPPVVQLMLYTDYEIINGSEYKDAKMILLPINETLEGDHWFLVVVNLLENTLLIYDSMSGENPQFIENVKQKLINYKLVTPKIKVIQVNIEQQANFDDCGVYLIMITCYIISMVVENNINLDLSALKFNPLKARLDIFRLIDHLITQEP